MAPLKNLDKVRFDRNSHVSVDYCNAEQAYARTQGLTNQK
jgi:hypothetical protein